MLSTLSIVSLYIIIFYFSDLPISYYFNTVIFIFNLFDCVGRYLPNYTKISLRSLRILTVSRIFIFIIFGIVVGLQKYEVLSVR